MDRTETVTADRRQKRRVVLATGVGTTIEWYDFFIYAQASALVFGPVFFKSLGAQAGLLVSLATVGISFLFRPVGALIAGHFGDKVGRRRMLVITLFLMGGATALIGALPTPDTIGVAAPILLLVLRIAQGLSAGGEWGGAALMAVESAPANRRGRFGSAPQQGAPVGLLLATGYFALMTAVTPNDAAFLSWGWRVPFLSSAVLVFVGYFIRRRVEESPTFVEMTRGGQVRKAPLGELFRTRPLLVLVAALAYCANSAGTYVVTGGFLQSYMTSPAHPGHLSKTTVLLMVTLSGLLWLVALHFAALLSDRIGRRTTFVIGWITTIVMTFPLLLAMKSGNAALLFVAMTLYMGALMITSGPLAAYMVELFPAGIRYSGIAVAYALGSILGGAFAPLIATALYDSTGSVYSVGWYVVGIVAVSLCCTLLLRDRSRVDLGPNSKAYDGSSFYLGRAAGEVERDPSTVAP
ncbi:MFS transporter [Amycolatopsis pithecellobii]|uniref:MFS transporter n=1 Tax=Amycolatopsis pithecellobii TaxID=664692 RepID=A0A6N7ZB09_9PSEU|nr:MFS transporter [Amycolatopsis pithecellobii]MTD58946.1 MFS transporter [Amycolatopsis pithecellobii]